MWTLEGRKDMVGFVGWESMLDEEDGQRARGRVTISRRSKYKRGETPPKTYLVFAHMRPKDKKAEQGM